MVIYKITNIQNNKAYIGQTINKAEERWKRHQQDALSNRLDTHFARAIRLYGPENFKLEVIDTANTQEELTKKEHDWILFYNSVEDGYNETAAEEKCGGNTYKSKTEEELIKIGQKIADSKRGGLNVNATSVKCRNIETKEEYFFESQSEMQNFFNENNHAFISRRCRGIIKKPYLDKWEIAFADKDYNEALEEPTDKKPSKSRQCKSIIVKNLQSGEEKEFNSYASAERYFELKPRCLSAKASKKPDIFVYKEQYQVTKKYN